MTQELYSVTLIPKGGKPICIDVLVDTEIGPGKEKCNHDKAEQLALFEYPKAEILQVVYC